MPWKAQPISLTEKQQNILEEISSSRSERNDIVLRSLIILHVSSGMSDNKIIKKLNVCKSTVSRWKRRWLSYIEQLILLDEKESGINYKRAILRILSDAERPGARPKFSSEQICQIIKVACESPDKLGLPLSHWSLTSLADELVKRKIVESISTSQLSVFLKSSRDKTSQNEGMDPYSNRK